MLIWFLSKITGFSGRSRRAISWAVFELLLSIPAVFWPQWPVCSSWRARKHRQRTGHTNKRDVEMILSSVALYAVLGLWAVLVLSIKRHPQSGQQTQAGAMLVFTWKRRTSWWQKASRTGVTYLDFRTSSWRNKTWTHQLFSTTV